METEKIEQQVAGALLEKGIKVQVGRMTYTAAPASFATLVLVSELVSQLPVVRMNEENIFTESLCVAKDCRLVGEIAAVLILGAKGLKETREVVENVLFGLWHKKKMVVIDKQKELAEDLLNELSPSKLNALLTTLLRSMEIEHFFGLTTSLLEINLLRQTREVTTTASGQQ